MEEQTENRKIQIYQRSLALMNAASNIFIQRVPASYVKRLIEHSDKVDPLSVALEDLDSIFSSCKSKLVDMRGSVEAIVEEFKEDSSGQGCLFLAWQLTYDSAQKRMNAPQLVGLATVHFFRSTSNFSTSRQELSDSDHRILKPYFGTDWFYIDAMCSTRAGVGRLLVQHVYAHALKKRKKGVIAFSYARRKSDIPESKKLFQSLKFTPLIEKATFKVQNMHGTWFTLNTKDVSLTEAATASVKVCTRGGFTPKTANTLIWRCPS